MDDHVELLSCHASLAWLFVPLERLSSSFSLHNRKDPKLKLCNNPGKGEIAVEALLARSYPGLSPEHLQLVIQNRPWWLALEELVSRLPLGSLSRIGEKSNQTHGRRNQSGKDQFRLLDLHRRLPPELRLAVHFSQTKGNALFPEMSDLLLDVCESKRSASTFCDLHSHLLGAVPEPLLWAVAMGGHLRAKETHNSDASMPIDEEDGAGDMNRPTRIAELVVEAAFLRWTLAEIHFPDKMCTQWSDYCQQNKRLYHDNVCCDGLRSDISLAIGNAILRNFVLDNEWTPPDGVDAFSDPLTNALKLQNSETTNLPYSNGEVSLLRRIFTHLKGAAVGRGDRANAERQLDIAAMGAHYIHLRCIFRTSMMLQAAESGLYTFTKRYTKSTGWISAWIPPDRYDEQLAEIREPSSSIVQLGNFRRDAGLLRWIAGKAVLASQEGGANGTEFRVGFDRRALDIKTELLALVQGCHDAMPDHRIAFIHQIHRNGTVSVDRVTGLLDLARSRDEENGWRLARSITGMDLVGREAPALPMKFMPLFQATQSLRSSTEKGSTFRWHVHVGEDNYHPLTGLRCIHWCLHELNLRPGDRLAHVLALTEGPRTAITRAGARALDLSWAYCELIKLKHRVLAEKVGTLFSALKSGLGEMTANNEERLEDWIPRLTEAEPRVFPGKWNELVFVEPQKSDRKVFLVLQQMLIREIKARGVVLEACPSSNIAVRGGWVEWPPIRRFPPSLKIKWVIGTDDHTLLANGLREELALVSSFGLSDRALGHLKASNDAASAHMRSAREWLELEGSEGYHGF